MTFFLIIIMQSFSYVSDPDNTIRKVNKYLELINTKRTVDFQSAINCKVCSNATASHKLPSSEESYEWEPFNASSDGGFAFGETIYEWFAFQGDVSVDTLNFDPKIHQIYLNFQVSRKYLVRPWDDDTPAGPEGRIWLDGKPYTAIDEFHDGATFSEGITSGHVEARIFTARCKSSPTLQKFGLTLIHKATEELYHRIRFLLSVIKELPEDNIDRSHFVKILDQTVRHLDIRDLNYPINLPEIRQHDAKTQTKFYESVRKSLDFLLSSLKSMPKFDSRTDPAISIIGYSHIDTCWLWPFDITRFKSANTATSMLRLIDNPPEPFKSGHEAQWKFLATSAQHYKWLKEDMPEVFERILGKIKEGRWNADGASWVEPDTTLPSGESLVRQIVMGTRFFNQEVPNSRQTVLFLPDCFGFSANLPQILRKSGLDSFVTSKISWCEYTKFPHSTFNWRGIDGSDVFAHFITTPSAWNYQTATYTGVSTAYEMIGTLKQYKQKEILPTSALHTSGNGDGGGGITEEMVWNLNLMNELPRVSGVPRLIFPTLEEIFVPIRKKKDELPIWDDELYLEYHRGTLTSQEEVKRQNRLLEAHLHNSEWLIVVLGSIFLNDDEKNGSQINIKKIQKEIDSIWEDTLLFHFHDAIPGSSVNEANQDIIRRGRPHLKRLRQIEEELSKEIISHIRTPTKENAEIIINTLSHTRYLRGQRVEGCGWTVKSDTAVIQQDLTNTTTYERLIPKKVDKKEEVNNTNDNNNKEDEKTFEMHTLHEPFISTTLAPCLKGKSPKIIINREDLTVTTPFLKVEFNKNGTIEHAIDLSTGRDYFSSPGNQFELYEDRPINWPAWDIQLYHKEMQINPPIFTGFEFKAEEACIILNFEIERVGDGNAATSTIKQTVTFSEDLPIIDFQTVVNWTQHDKLLKVAFPTTIRSRNARFGIQFGHIQRPTHKNTRRDMAKFEASGRWADLSESSNGVSLCSDVKVGFDVHENILRLSLLKAPMQTDQWADFGIRKFAYRLNLHKGGFDQSNIVSLSDDLNTPVVLAKYVQPTSPIKDDVSAVPCETQFAVVSDENVVLETLKPAYINIDEQQQHLEKGKQPFGFVARLYESSGGWRSCNITFPLLEAAKWEVKVVDLHENEIHGNINDNKNENESHRVKVLKEETQLTVNVEFSAFELVSILFTRK